MSERSDEFSRIAKAERQLCEEAGPALVAIVRAIEAQAGFQITEVRVTFDPTDRSMTAANCTIVGTSGPAASAACASSDSNAYHDRA